jgi:hypothetical protein
MKKRLKMIDRGKDFYQNELDLQYELLNKTEKLIEEYGSSKDILEIKNTILFRIKLIENILSTFIN